MRWRSKKGIESKGLPKKSINFPLNIGRCPLIFIREEEEEINAAIRLATSTGRPLGGEGFIRKLEKRLNRHLFPKKGGQPKGKRKK
ncbi:MAG: hypothetical protein WCO26_09065 [Deltaproteobacteria bacterium]